MGDEKTWEKRYHWYVKSVFLLITGLLALTGNQLLIALFAVAAIWMLVNVLLALHGAYWMWSRHRQYTRMTQYQRDEMERGLIYALENLDMEATRILELSGLHPEVPAYQEVAKRRRTAQDVIMLNEQWRSELWGIPARPLYEIRHSWVVRDPYWLAAETAKLQESARREEERAEWRAMLWASVSAPPAQPPPNLYPYPYPTTHPGVPE